jgi:hypothetical protein
MCDYDKQALLLKRIGFALDQSWESPNHCLASQCDLESGIVDVLQRLPVNFSYYNHVKYHGDEECAVKKVPWDVQMKCHVDAHATD